MHLAISSILLSFRPLFSHKATFVSFLFIMLGFLFRFDFYGVSSTIRCLGLPETSYYALLRLFNSKAWSLDQMVDYWIGWCQKHFSLLVVNDRIIAIGDAIKIPKEAQCQPGVVPQYENSNNSAKVNRFHGHTFGGICLLSGLKDKIFGIPVFFRIHEGLNALNHLREEGGLPRMDRTQITRMVASLIQVAFSLDSPIYGVLDAQYATGKSFLLCQYYDIKTKKPWVHLITKAKRNYTAYPNQEKKRKEKIKLWDRFLSKEDFIETVHPVNGHVILYHFENLFWPPANVSLRFVWIQQGKSQYLLMASDLSLDPITCIQLYSLRVKIEQTFKILKHVIGAFCYRFWTFTSPKLEKKKVKKKDQTKEVSSALPEITLQKIIRKVNAIESFVYFAAIITGILQYIALYYSEEVWKSHARTSWLRTYSSKIPSEEVVKRVIQSEYFIHPGRKHFQWIRALISNKKLPPKISFKTPKNRTLTRDTPSLN